MLNYELKTNFNYEYLEFYENSNLFSTLQDKPGTILAKLKIRTGEHWVEYSIVNYQILNGFSKWFSDPLNN